MLVNDTDFIEVTTKLRRRRILKMAYNQPIVGGKKIPAVSVSGAYLHDIGLAVGGRYELTINVDNSITLRGVSDDDSSQVEPNEG